MLTLHQLIVGLLSITLLCGTQSCRVLYDQTTEKVPARDKAKKNYYVAPFEAIELNGVANVSFSQSDKIKVEAIGPENFLPFVVIESHDGVLMVNTREIGNKRAGNGLEIKITAPTLRHLSNNGVGNFQTTSPLKVSELHIENTGVGNTRLTNIECDRLTVDHTGVGDLRLSGHAREASYQSNGVGDVRAKDLKAQHVELNHSGVGDITCYASENIRIRAHGVGDVIYYGNPRVLKQSKSNIGSLIAK